MTFKTVFMKKVNPIVIVHQGRTVCKTTTTLGSVFGSSNWILHMYFQTLGWESVELCNHILYLKPLYTSYALQLVHTRLSLALQNSPKHFIMNINSQNYTYISV